MKLKFLLYGLLGLLLLFAGLMGYLLYSSRSAISGFGEGGSQESGRAIVNDRAKTVSGKAGKLLILYAGDLAGNLDPCG